MKGSSFIIGAFFLYIFLALGVYFFAGANDAGFVLRNVFYLGAPAIAIAAGSYAVWSYGIPNSHATSLTFIVVGLGLWFIGEILFFSFSLRDIDPFPSIADVFYIIGYVPLAIGFIRESRSDFNGVRIRDLFLFFALLLALCVVTGAVSVFGAYDPSVDLVSNSILIGYGMGDLFLIATLLPILIFVSKHTGGTISIPWRLLFLGLIAILAADLLYSVFNQGYDARDVRFLRLDLVWIFGYLVLACGFIAMGRSLRRLARLAGRSRTRPSNAAAVRP
ncbi:MAG: hypothetical protein U0517_03200 [Candidatus Andersenbacteria bacterium]